MAGQQVTRLLISLGRVVHWATWQCFMIDFWRYYRSRQLNGDKMLSLCLFFRNLLHFRTSDALLIADWSVQKRGKCHLLRSLNDILHSTTLQTRCLTQSGCSRLPLMGPVNSVLHSTTARPEWKQATPPSVKSCCTTTTPSTRSPCVCTSFPGSLVADRLQMHYAGCMSPPVTHGSNSDQRTEIVLQPGEVVTCVRGNYYNEMVAQLSFTTNKGVTTSLLSTLRCAAHSGGLSQGSITGRMAGPIRARSRRASSGMWMIRRLMHWMAAWDCCTSVDARGMPRPDMIFWAWLISSFIQ